jgi:hypothetical protein
MKPESEKLNEVLNLLRKSKPVLDSTNDIEREVIRRISKNNRSGLRLSGVLDFLFSWVYIGWVRRTLIAASATLVLIFIYQQGIILKRIEVLSRQTVVTEKENLFTHTDEIERLLMAYRNYGKKFPSKTITISESQMDELLESVKELQLKYKDLDNLIDGDPELKKLIEQKLTNSNRNKVNL